MFFKQKSKLGLDGTKIPQHIGIIMDGNGRWAKRRSLPRSAGHRAGAETLRKISEHCDKLGVKAITAYAFSTENWSRPKEEVDTLMDLLYEYLSDYKKNLGGKNAVIKVIGDRSRLSDKINGAIDKTEDYTKNNTGITLALAVNYGGRNELISATRALAKDAADGKLNASNITDTDISSRLYTRDLPDVDLIIRPSGEKRLSNFLLWQAAYAELWFSDINWPDFTTRDIERAIYDYQQRDRRFGR